MLSFFFLINLFFFKLKCIDLQYHVSFRSIAHQCTYLYMWFFIPYAHSRSLLVIYFIYSSVYMLLATSNCPFSFGNHKFIFHVYESFSVLEISSFEYFLFLDSTCKWYCNDICLFLSTLFHLVWYPLSSSIFLQITLFLLLSNIPWYKYTTFSLSIHLLMDIYIASISWLL